jgi:hypothetical protein
MFALNDNDQSKKYDRFMDLGGEPLTVMTPIKGYEKLPLVSLEQAVQPLIPYIPEIEQMVDIAIRKCRKPPPDNLTEDQSAAIMLYTMEWEPKEDSVYQRLNKALRTEDRQVLKPWFLYLKLLVKALSLLPSNSRTVYRGIKSDEKHRYKKGQKLVWWGFSSCTSTLDVLQNESFMGSSGQRTMFAIECHTGKEIREHSYFKGEDEILLPAAREFQVESVFPQADGLCLIQLKEVQPKYPLLESFSTISHIVQKAPLVQVHPIQIQPAVPTFIYKPVDKQSMQISQSKF